MNSSYFKNGDALKNQIDKNEAKKMLLSKRNNLKNAIPTETMQDVDKLKHESFKRNSKSNTHIRKENIPNFPDQNDNDLLVIDNNSGINIKRVPKIIASNPTQTQIMKESRFSQVEPKFPQREVNNFIGGFQNIRDNNNTADSRRHTFTGTFRDSYHSPIPTKTNANWWAFEKKESAKTTAKAKVNLHLKKFDSAIIDMMQKLGYCPKNIYSGLVMGNQHIVAAYEKLVQERQNAINFMNTQ